MCIYMCGRKHIEFEVLLFRILLYHTYNVFSNHCRIRLANMFVKRLFWLKDVSVNAKIRNQTNMSSRGLRLAEGCLIPNCVAYSEQQLKNIFVNIDSIAGNIVRLSDRQSEVNLMFVVLMSDQLQY